MTTRSAAVWDARAAAENILGWLDPSQRIERQVCETLLQYHDALKRIENWPFDVNVTPESDLRAVKEQAARALRGEA